MRALLVCVVGACSGSSTHAPITAPPPARAPVVVEAPPAPWKPAPAPPGFRLQRNFTPISHDVSLAIADDHRRFDGTMVIVGDITGESPFRAWLDPNGRARR